MSDTIWTAIVGASNLVIGLCIGYYISNKLQREHAHRDALSRQREVLISDKVRLLNEIPKSLIVGNVSVVQVVVENLKSIFKKETNIISSIDSAWDTYYRNEHNRDFNDVDKKRLNGAVHAIDSLISLIDNHL